VSNNLQENQSQAIGEIRQHSGVSELQQQKHVFHLLSYLQCGSKCNESAEKWINSTCSINY